MAIAISKLVSREFQYVQMELQQMAELCHKEGALLKVILENAYLSDELKIIACRCCERAAGRPEVRAEPPQVPLPAGCGRSAVSPEWLFRSLANGPPPGGGNDQTQKSKREADRQYRRQRQR